MSYEFISARYVSFDFVPVEEMKALNRRLKKLLYRNAASRSTGKSYLTNVQYYHWGKFNNEKFAEIVERVFAKKYGKYEASLLKELVSDVVIESCELERPPIYLVSVTARISQESLVQLQQGPTENYEKLANILRLFMAEAISGVASRHHTGAPSIAQYGVCVDKKTIGELLDHTKTLLNLLKTTEFTESLELPSWLKTNTFDEFLKISNKIRNTKILEKTLIKPDRDFISVIPFGSNLIQIVGQRTEIGITEIPEFRNICIVTLATQRGLVEERPPFEPSLIPVTPIIPYPSPLGGYSYGITVLLWLKHHEIDTLLKADEQANLLDKIKRFPLDVSIDMIHEISSEITTSAIGILSFLERFYSMRRRIERNFKSGLKVLSTFYREVSLPVIDQDEHAFQFDYLSRYKDGISGLLAKEILDMFKQVEILLETQRRDFEYMVNLVSTKTSLRTDRELHRLTNRLTTLTYVLVCLTVVLAILALI